MHLTKLGDFGLARRATKSATKLYLCCGHDYACGYLWQKNVKKRAKLVMCSKTPRVLKPSEPRKKPQCIVYVRELYYITFAKEKCWVAKDRESNLLRERSRKRSLRYFKLFVLFSGNGPVGSWHRRYSGSLGSQLWESGVAARVVKCVEDCSQSSI